MFCWGYGAENIKACKSGEGDICWHIIELRNRSRQSGTANYLVAIYWSFVTSSYGSGRLKSTQKTTGKTKSLATPNHHCNTKSHISLHRKMGKVVKCISMKRKIVISFQKAQESSLKVGKFVWGGTQLPMPRDSYFGLTNPCLFRTSFKPSDWR